jgi:HEAT repeat protein
MVTIAAAAAVLVGGVLLLRRPSPLGGTSSPPAGEPAGRSGSPAGAGTKAADPAEVARVAEALAAALRERRAAEAVSGLARRQDSAALARALYERGTDEGLRQAAIDMAVASGDPAAVRWLRDLAHQDPVNGPGAAAALGAVSNQAAAPELAAILAGDQSAEVRASAARALGNAGGAEQRAALGDALGSPVEDLRVRQQAALSLGQVGGADSLGPLTAAWERSLADRTPQGEQLRLAILQGLARIPTPEARARLDAIAASKDLPATERAFLQRTRPAAGGGLRK